MTKKTSFCILLLLLCAGGAEAQLFERLVEKLTFPLNPAKVAEDSSRYPNKLILAPVVYYSPETSFGLGVGSKILFKPKKAGADTRTSNLPIAVTYTLNNQYIFNAGYEIFFNKEKWMLSGDLSIKNFPRLFYGVGRDTPDSNEESYDYTQILIQPLLLKQTPIRYLFVGAGFRYNRISNVHGETDGLLLDGTIPGAEGSTSVGTEFAIIYDNRDNILNAYSGYYIKITHGIYREMMGGTHQFQLSRLDMRAYFKPFVSNTVIAFQTKVHKTYEGTPFHELAFLGSGEIMRGYYEGRFVESTFLASQIELRQPLGERLGMVVFLAVGDVFPKFSDMQLSNLRLVGGAGLRLMIDKKERLNLRMDGGIGKGTSNYYLNISEAF